MPAYEYTAKDAGGATLTGFYDDIDGVESLQAELGKFGYTLLNAQRKKKLNKIRRQHQTGRYRYLCV